MNKDLIIWAAMGILAVLVIYSVFFKDSGAIISLAGQSQSSYSGMVGGC